MTWLAVQSALDAKLALLSGGTPIAWEGRVYQPTTGTLYLRTNMLPASTESAGIGSAGGQMLQGVYQVTVCAAIGLGTSPAITKADAVAAHFIRASLSGVQCGVPARGPALIDGAWFLIPVSIPFICHQP